MPKSPEHAAFCTRVKARRKELGLTQAEVAERLGISRPVVAEIENGKREPGLGVMSRLAEALESDEFLPMAAWAKVPA